VTLADAQVNVALLLVVASTVRAVGTVGACVVVALDDTMVQGCPLPEPPLFAAGLFPEVHQLAT
jgi:hypothetical protein